MTFRKALLSAGLLLFLAAPAFSAETKPTVRVLVSETQPRVLVSVKGAWRARVLPTLEIVKTGRRMVTVPVVATPRGIKIGDVEFPGKGVRIEAADERDLFLNKTLFRGSLDFQKDSAGKLIVINRLDVESYLYGVLHNEVSAWWPMQALEAQAVAARSYALYQASVSKAQPYDLKSGTSSQVYGGSTSERFRTKEAVDKTEGQVLTWQGKIFPAYFHATCAGQTAAASELWKIDLPPLGGRVLCGFCKISPHYAWTARVPLAEIEEILARNSRPVGRVLEMRIVTRTPSNRVGSLKITGTSGEATVAAKDFRIWIGGDRMRSTAFSIKLSEDFAEFSGRGWGHGVGLCQWGALGQALLGRKHDEILRFYYKGSAISDSYGT